MTKFKTQDVLAVAYAAYRKNKGYVKDTFRFSEPTNETAFSNKDYVKYLENGFRQECRMFGTPLRITLRNSTNPYLKPK